MFGTRLLVGIVIFLAFLLFVIPSIYVAVRTAIAEQVAVIEGRNGLDAAQRSFALTQGKFWRFLGLLAIMFGIVFGAAAAMQIPGTVLPAANHWLISAALGVLLDLLAGWLILTLVAAYWASAHSSEAGEQTQRVEAMP